MASILHNARVTATNKVKPINVRLVSSCIDERPLNAPIPFASEYMLSAEIRTTFWANDANYERAENEARRVLNQGIYSGALSCIARMKSAVYSEDMEQLLEIIGELEREIGL